MKTQNMLSEVFQLEKAHFCLRKSETVTLLEL